jgi:hypothetical protein
MYQTTRHNKNGKSRFQGTAGRSIDSNLPRPWTNDYCTDGQFWYWRQTPAGEEPPLAFPMPPVRFCYNFVLHFGHCEQPYDFTVREK